MEYLHIILMVVLMVDIALNIINHIETAKLTKLHLMVKRVMSEQNVLLREQVRLLKAERS